MSNYKLIALDMDGTLLNEECQISQENQYWIERALQEGVTVIFSTGRGFLNAVPYADQIQLNTPMITVNGGEIWSKPHVLHRRKELEHSYVTALHQLALQYPEVWYWAYSIENIYNKENWLSENDEISNHRWLKFGYYTEDLVTLEKIKQEIQSWEALEMSNSSPYNIELNPYGVSKATALHELCELMSITMAEVIAAGDSLNDIKAIQQAGLGVAMGNAQEEVKQAADYITSTNDEDGVAEVIKKFIFHM